MGNESQGRRFNSCQWGEGMQLHFRNHNWLDVTDKFIKFTLEMFIDNILHPKPADRLETVQI